MNLVIDTNVAIAANGRETHASLACQFACIELLERLANSKSKDIVLLDSCELILDEYKRHLNFRGQPGVGDLFYKHLHDNAHSFGSVRLIRVTPNEIENQGFNELPANSLDKSDRKFLVVALIGNGTLFNALDTDWHEQVEFISGLGVSIEQLCPEHGCAMHLP